MTRLRYRIKTRAALPRPHRGDVEVLRLAAGAIAAATFDGCGERAAWFPNGEDLSVPETAAEPGRRMTNETLRRAGPGTAPAGRAIHIVPDIAWER